MLRHLQRHLIPLRNFATTNAAAPSSTPPESRWRRLKRERRHAPTPPNRTAYNFDRKLVYPLDEALSHVRSARWANFDESVEIIFRLNIDPRHADQNVRSHVILPHSRGHSPVVGVFADEAAAPAVKALGAADAGAEEFAERLRDVKMAKRFDVILAQPHLMGMVAGKVGRVLGPRGLMPSERDGTVWNDVEGGMKVVKRLVRFRTDRAGNVQMAVGKISMGNEVLKENVVEVVRRVLECRPQSVRRKFVDKVVVCTSMGPGVGVSVEDLVRLSVQT